jgi:hypothetical protein
MLKQNEKIYLTVLISSIIIQIFTILYITNNCPNCEEIFSRKHLKPIVVYQIN